MLSSMNTSMKKKDISSLSLQSKPNQTKRTTIMTQVTKNNIVELSADDLNVVTGGYDGAMIDGNGVISGGTPEQRESLANNPIYKDMFGKKKCH
jgi:hypothetical protein